MKTQPIRRFALSRWSFRSALLPASLFWIASCTTAVAVGVGIAYFVSPDPGVALETSAPESSAPETPALETSTPARSSSVASNSAPGEGDGGDASRVTGARLARFEGTPLQVLNASTNQAAAESMASVLEEEGFSVEVVETARRVYRRTTVFWTPGEGRRAALALAERFGWRSAPKPATLTDEIPVHVVVGQDEIS